MAIITLRSVFLHDATDLADLSAFLELENVEELGEHIAGPETTRLYAGGNSRRTLGRGSLTTLTVKMTRCTPTQAARLAVWAKEGTQLLWRDPRRRVLLGGWAGKQLDVVEYPAIDAADVTGTFAAVTEPAAAVPAEA